MRKGEKKEKLTEVLNPPSSVVEMDNIKPAANWEEQRKKMVDLAYETALLDPAATGDKMKIPAWAKKKYPGMDFNWVPSHPDDLGKYVGSEWCWNIVPSEKNPMGGKVFEDGRVHRGDTILVMRPVEISGLIKQREEQKIAENYGPPSRGEEAMQEIIRDMNRGRNAPAIRIRTEKDTRILTDPGGPDGLAERDAERAGFRGVDPEDQPRQGGPPRYVHGIGPSKRFGGNE